MSKKSNNTALLIVGGGVLAYLIFKKAKTTTTAATPAPGSPGSLMSQATNLLTSIFGGSTLPSSPASQAALVQQASNPDNVAVVDTSTYVAPVTAAPAPSQGMSLDIQAPVYSTSGGATSEYISSDASLMDQESIGTVASSWTGKPLSSMSGAYSWAGKNKGVFSGRNKQMNPFTEINGTGLAALGCLACMLPGSGNAIGKIDFSKYILPVGIVVGGYLLLKNTNLFSGVKTGVTANNEATTVATQASLTTSIASAAASGDLQTLTNAQLASLANDIATQGLLSTPNQDQIEHDIIQVNTLTDLLQMMYQFGTRQGNTGSWFSTCGLLGLNCQALDMPTFVRLAVDSSHLSAINNYLTAQNINYQF
jgi:hypothetical protein